MNLSLIFMFYNIVLTFFFFCKQCLNLHRFKGKNAPETLKNVAKYIKMY